MTVDGALIREQGISFAVVIVKPTVLSVPSHAEKTIRDFAPIFGGVPIVLMAQDSGGRPTYYGRTDIARFMANVPLGSVRWKRFNIS